MQAQSHREPAILLVDDHPANLMALRAVLDPLGYELVDARSGMEAIRLSESREFAVVLMDVQMPGLDGLETTSLLRNRRGSSLVPIIFITALDRDVNHARRGYERGAVDYIFKPVEPEILCAKVAVFVELHRQREKLRLQAEQLHEPNASPGPKQKPRFAREEDILAIVSHELGNPITAAGTYADLLRKYGRRLRTKRSSLMPLHQLTALHRMDRLVSDLTRRNAHRGWEAQNRQAYPRRRGSRCSGSRSLGSDRESQVANPGDQHDPRHACSL